MRVGGNDGDRNPSQSDYTGYREYAYGAGWKVWVGLSGNPPFLEAPLKTPLPVPTSRPADDITRLGRLPRVTVLP